MHRVFSIIVAIIFLSGISQKNFAAEPSPLFDLSGSAPELTPDITRREVSIPKIDALDVEVGIYGGVLSVEDFGANYLVGLSGSFHFTEDFFVNANIGWSEIDDETYRRANLPLFGDNKTKKVQDLNALLGWNYLRGEMFWGNKHVFTTDLYLVAGAGTINFDSEDYFTWLVGSGLKVLPKDWIAIRIEGKLSQYRSSLLGYKKYTHNMDMLIGVNVYF